MSGKERSLQINNFLKLIQQNGDAATKEKYAPLGMSVEEIYTMLESPSPGFLKRDVLRYTKANNISTESLRTFPDVQLLRLKMAHVHVFPHSRRRISQMQKSSTNKANKEAQLVSNFPPYTTPKITRTILTMCEILNPHEIFEITPVLSLGEGSAMEVPQTWRNPGKSISDMSAKALTSHRDKAQTSNLPKCSKVCGREPHLDKVTIRVQNRKVRQILGIIRNNL